MTQRTLVALLAILLCSCGSSDPAAPAAGPTVPSLTAGSGELAIIVPFGGVIPVETILTTDAGVRLVIAAGTQLRTQKGARISGPITIGIDAAGGAAVWPGVAGLLGTARVYVLLGPAGMEVPTPVHFDPPAQLEAPLPVPEEGGGFALFTWKLADGRFHLGGPPGGTPDTSGAAPLGLGFAGALSNGAVATADVENTGVFGPTHVSDQPVATKFRQVGMSVDHEIELPPEKDGVKIKSIAVINPKTGQIVHIWNPSNGADVGEGRARMGGGETWILSIAEVMGKRVIRLTTNYSNNFVFRVLFCDDPEWFYTDESTGDGGGGDEGDEDGEYIGYIRIIISGWGGFLNYIDADETIEMVFGFGNAALRVFTAGQDGYAAILNLFGTSASTQAIIDMLPPEWMYVAGDRKIEITIPCPPAVVLTKTPVDDIGMGMNGAVNILDVMTLMPGPNIPMTAGNGPFNAVVDPQGENAFVVSDNTIQHVDITMGTIGTPVVVPGARRAICLSPTQEHLYCMTDAGVFLALQVPSLTVDWQTPMLPPGQYDDVCVALDGAFAYTADVTLGNVVPIDLLRRNPLPPMPIGGGNMIRVSFDGMFLGVLDTAGGGIRTIDSTTGTPSGLLPTGPMPVEFRWTPTNQIAVADGAANQVAWIDANSGMAAPPIVTNGPAISFGTYTDPAGNGWGLVVLQGNQIQRFQLMPGAMAQSPQPAPTGTDGVRCNGQ